MFWILDPSWRGGWRLLCTKNENRNSGHNIVRIFKIEFFLDELFVVENNSKVGIFTVNDRIDFRLFFLYCETLSEMRRLLEFIYSVFRVNRVNVWTECVLYTKWLTHVTSCTLLGDRSTIGWCFVRCVRARRNEMITKHVMTSPRVRLNHMSKIIRNHLIWKFQSTRRYHLHGCGCVWVEQCSFNCRLTHTHTHRIWIETNRRQQRLLSDT